MMTILAWRTARRTMAGTEAAGRREAKEKMRLEW